MFGCAMQTHRDWNTSLFKFYPRLAFDRAFCEDGTVEVAALNVDALKRCTSEVGSTQVCTVKLCFAVELGIGEVCTPKVGVCEVDIGEVRTSQVCPPQIPRRHVEIAEINLREVCKRCIKWIPALTRRLCSGLQQSGQPVSDCLFEEGQLEERRLGSKPPLHPIQGTVQLTGPDPVQDVGKQLWVSVNEKECPEAGMTGDEVDVLKRGLQPASPHTLVGGEGLQGGLEAGAANVEVHNGFQWMIWERLGWIMLLGAGHGVVLEGQDELRELEEPGFDEHALLQARIFEDVSREAARPNPVQNVLESVWVAVNEELLVAGCLLLQLGVVCKGGLEAAALHAVAIGQGPRLCFKQLSANIQLEGLAERQGGCRHGGNRWAKERSKER